MRVPRSSSPPDPTSPTQHQKGETEQPGEPAPAPGIAPNPPHPLHTQPARPRRATAYRASQYVERPTDPDCHRNAEGLAVSVQEQLLILSETCQQECRATLPNGGHDRLCFRLPVEVAMVPAGYHRAIETVRMGSGPLAPLANATMRHPLTRALMERTLGVSRERTLPAFAPESFTSWFRC